MSSACTDTVARMEGYDSTTYGRAFADIYDEWYRGISDVDQTVALLAELCERTDDLPVVELGVGTGRLALPLAERVAPRPVIGIDSSAEMLDVMRAKCPEHSIATIVGDMVDDMPSGPLGLVFVAYNTLFNLRSAERQRGCFAAVAERLAPNGSFVIEAFVPEDPPRIGDHIDVRDLTADRVVLSIARRHPDDQSVDGQFVELTEAGGVRLRPWSIRYAAPSELDGMATDAGLHLEARWESFDKTPFSDDSVRHVSLYVPARSRVAR